MKYIEDLKIGDSISEVYLCKEKRSGTTKNGADYFLVTLQDKTGVLEGNIWDVNSPGINEFDKKDYVEVSGMIKEYKGKNQINITSLRVVDVNSVNVENYIPTTDKDVDEMYGELLDIIGTIKAPYMKKLLEMHFVNDETFIKKFRYHSAAKSVHHGFAGGLLEHTLSVTKTCDFIAKQYDYLDRDLLLTAAIFHDVGKLAELSPYPENDYTDAGQMLGHIVIGYNMLSNSIRKIDDFPKVKRNELLHCILAHHGEYEYGSPKKPSIAEAIALNFADDMDAKLETMKEVMSKVKGNDISWQGFNYLFDSNIRKTSEAYDAKKV